jgi:hypothetical protein
MQADALRHGNCSHIQRKRAETGAYKVGMSMRLTELVERIGAGIATHRDKATTIEIERVYAGDKVSDMLNEVSQTTLLVTNLTTGQILRVAELMDVPSICLVNGVEPSPDLLKAAHEREVVLVVSPVDLFSTCGRLYECLPTAGKTVS